MEIRERDEQLGLGERIAVTAIRCGRINAGGFFGSKASLRLLGIRMHLERQRLIRCKNLEQERQPRPEPLDTTLTENAEWIRRDHGVEAVARRAVVALEARWGLSMSAHPQLRLGTWCRWAALQRRDRVARAPGVRQHGVHHASDRHDSRA